MKQRRNTSKEGCGEDSNDIDNSIDSVEKQLNSSASSMMITTSWNSKNSRSRFLFISDILYIIRNKFNVFLGKPVHR